MVKTSLTLRRVWGPARGRRRLSSQENRGDRGGTGRTCPRFLDRVRRGVAVASPAWLHSDSGGRCFPTARRVTCTSWTALGGVVTYEPQAGAETVAEGWIVPGAGRRALPRRARPERCRRRRDVGAAGDHRPRLRSTAAARLRVGRRHVLDPRPRGPAAAGPGRSTHRPHQALHPQLRPRGRARRAPGVRRPGGAARRRLGQAGRRLDRPRLRRPRAVLPARTRSPRPSGSRTSTAPRSPPTASARRCCPD